jgi:putative tricarboxylic transport membrane protein
MISSLQSKDFLAGLMFVALGAFGLWLGRDLAVGTSDAMETGYFPRMICLLLMGTGALVSAVALVQPGEPAEAWHWRPLILITLATVAFAALLKPLGFVLAVLVAVLLSGFARRAPRFVPLVALAVALVVVTAGLFVFALRMPIPLWPSAL